MTTKILRKSTLALILALLTSGLGKVFVQSAPPSPVPAHPTPQIADGSGGAPDPCESGNCFVPVQPTPVPSATLQIADGSGGAPDPCESGNCFAGVHFS